MIRHLAMHFILKSEIHLNPQWPDDIKIMHKALFGGKTIDFKDAGTPLRLCTALLSQAPGTILTGNKELIKRPLKPLLQSLEHLGARFSYHHKDYALPFTVIKPCNAFTSCSIDDSQSSQFTSALLLLACTQKQKVRVYSEAESQGKYIQQTLSVIAAAGIQTAYKSSTYELWDQENMGVPKEPIEKDYSSLVFLLNLALARPHQTFCINGLNPQSIQADKAAIALYKKLGMDFTWEGDALFFCYIPQEQKKMKLDIKSCIDLAPALIAACAFLGTSLVLTGYENLKYKESNRIQAMNENLIQLGYPLQEDKNNLVLKGSLKKVPRFHIRSFEDHRIVMAMSLFAIDQAFSCDNKGCVSKSFPSYWAEFEMVKNII